MTMTKKKTPDVINSFEEYLRAFYPPAPDDHELRHGRRYPMTDELATAALVRAMAQVRARKAQAKRVHAAK